MKTIAVQTRYGTAPVANYHKGKLAFWRRHEGLIYSELPPRPCKDLRQALSFISHAYRTRTIAQ